MVPLSCFLLPLMDVFSSSCAPNCAAPSLLSHWPAPFYIRLSFSTKNTAWSVCCISTYLNQRYSMYFSLTWIYLIFSPTWIYLIFPRNLDLQVFTLLLSRCSFVPSTLNSLCNRLLPGVVTETPDILDFSKTPFENPLPLTFQVYVCLYLSQV